MPGANSISILNKLYSADVADKSFKDPDTGETRNYSTLDITIKLNGKKRVLNITLPKSKNFADLLIAAEDKPSNLFDDQGEENM